MKSETTLKDFYGKIIGFIETDEYGTQTIKNFYRQTLGWYYPKQNITRDFFQSVVGSGNLLTLLLERDMQNNK